MVLMQLEDYGVCRKGESGPFVESGAIRYAGGSLPVNTHGGQLSEACITGLVHIVEGGKQMRGAAGRAGLHHHRQPHRTVLGGRPGAQSAHAAVHRLRPVPAAPQPLLPRQPVDRGDRDRAVGSGRGLQLLGDARVPGATARLECP